MLACVVPGGGRAGCVEWPLTSRVWLRHLQIDNWALARVSILGFDLDFIDGKVCGGVRRLPTRHRGRYLTHAVCVLCRTRQAAFTAGASYVNKVAGEMLSNAQATLGNIVSSVRALPGRALGYLNKFRKKLDEVSAKITFYLNKGEEFLDLAAQFEDVGDVVQRLALHGLLLLEKNVTALMAKCVAGLLPKHRVVQGGGIARHQRASGCLRLTASAAAAAATGTTSSPPSSRSPTTRTTAA